MTDKEMIINGVDVSECEHSFEQFNNWVGKDVVMCDCTLGYRCEPKENHCKFYMYYLEQQLKRKKQEYEELRRYHNKCCEENTEKLKQWLEKYNQLSRDFYNGKYCNKENCSLLKAKEQEYKNLKEELRCYRRSIKDISIESTEICKILEKYKQALDKIEEFCTVYSDNHDAYETVYKQILDFISKSEEV